LVNGVQGGAATAACQEAISPGITNPNRNHRKDLQIHALCFFIGMLPLSFILL